ncbi:unnamed protein product [Prorocentrum cordatum]|uniref:Major facilitator superfamily (MFS) profile domain-containing protein n=1 Tax=Prorocentrum cordatum TaxID=2364126 RepID=A0ABN9QY50_9DINO|nr:unnamed protein product [Polarella glacialis]
MVETLRGTSHRVGLYTGLLSSATASGMLLSAYMWASVSNRRGRRFCLLIGLAAGATITALQAFCRSYWFLIALRFLSGLLNSNLSITRTALRETFQHEGSEDTWAFSTLSVAFSASCMAGPSLGGLLYGRAAPWPLEARPWSAAMLLSTLLYACSMALAWWRLPETAFLAAHAAPHEGPDGLRRVEEEGPPAGRQRPLLRDANFLLLLVMGGGHSYVFTGWEIAYPLLARLPAVQRGEQWTAAQIGVAFLAGSCGLCAYCLALYPRIARRVPVVRIWLFSWVAPLLVLPAFPRALALLCEGEGGPCAGRPLAAALNFAAQACISVLLGSGFISVQVLLNGYVGARPDAPTALALANSMLVSTQALARAVSPVATGWLFALGLEQEGEGAPGLGWASRSLPFDGLALVGLAACLACGAAFEARTLLAGCGG